MVQVDRASDPVCTGTPAQLQWAVAWPVRAVPADVNGDGRDDVLFHNQSAANTGLLMNRCLPAAP